MLKHVLCIQTTCCEAGGTQTVSFRSTFWLFFGQEHPCFLSNHLQLPMHSSVLIRSKLIYQNWHNVLSRWPKESVFVANVNMLSWWYCHRNNNPLTFGGLTLHITYYVYNRRVAPRKRPSSPDRGGDLALWRDWSPAFIYRRAKSSIKGGLQSGCGLEKRPSYTEQMVWRWNSSPYQHPPLTPVSWSSSSRTVKPKR